MSGNILYILGAGASCNVLPLGASKIFTERLVSFETELRRTDPRKIKEKLEPVDEGLWGTPKKDFMDAIQWLADETSHHVSVDTFAKKLFFLGDRVRLHKLKSVLSAFFVTEQARNNVDERYDAFLAAILKINNHQISLPNELRIITWNYDTQLEKAFYGFCDNSEHVIKEITFNKNFYRINGYCGTTQTGKIGSYFKVVWNATQLVAWENGIRLYNEYVSRPSANAPEICFAWEDQTRDRTQKMDLDLKQVSTVVVIGYSFPYFNREIDQSIFLDLNNIGRIYLQYPKGSHYAMKERISPLLNYPLQINEQSDTEQFYIPDELSLPVLPSD